MSTLRDKNGTVRTFNSQGFLTAITDRTGNTVTVVRNGAQIQQILEPGGRALTFQYSGGGISQITDPLGRTVTYTYEGVPVPYAFPRLRSVTNPAGGTTTYTYVPTFKPYDLARITDARGITYLTNTYCSSVGGTTCPPDPAIVTQTAADGGITRFEYVVTNRAVTQATVTDPRGHQSVHRFNSRGHEVVVVDTLGQQTRLTRDYVTNQVMEVRDPLNRLTKYTYDTNGNVTSVIDPQGNPTLVEYEPTFNRVTKITDALNQITRFTYDPANGNLLTITDPRTHTTTVAYNAVGQPIGVTDALNHSSTFEYDAVGNLIATTDPVGNKTQQSYDAVSRLTALIDPRGKTTQFDYDPVNQVSQITDALSGVTGFAYDPNGNLLTLTDAKNQVTTYTYDNMDRLATRKDALNRTESYGYDLAGNLSTFTDRKTQITTFQYDPLDRRTSTSYADSTSVTAAYDAVGNVTKLTDSATGAIDWTYDVLDRVMQEVTPQGIVHYTYDAISQRLTMRANAQPPVTYHYDANSQLSQVEQGTLSAILTHDALGRRTQLQRSNGVTTTYNYDPASRLLGITHAKGTTTLEQLTQGFDPADNKNHVTQLIQTATALPPAVTAAYNAVNAQMQFNSGTLGYDPNGNLTTDGTTTYVWDARDRLIGITGDGPPSGTGTVPVSATFSYDALNRRIAKTINGATSTFLYDGADVVTESGASNASYLSTLNIDEPLVRQTSTGNEYYHTDDLGSTIALSNDAGAVTTHYTYSPFGSTTVNGISTNPFQFTGRENDGNGLYFYRARYYNPSHGRFLAEDPLEFNAGDPNLYAYVFNNPTNFVDPTGEAVKLPKPVKQCLIGMIKAIGKAAGLNLGKRKPDIDPDDLLDAAKGCLGKGTPQSTGASSAKQGNDFKKHLGYSEKYGKGGVKELPDGRVRYYGNVDPAKTPGDMAGRRYVHEFDPATGRSRGWHETLDHDGNIRQVRPQLNNGGDKTHYTFDSDGNFTGKR
ncbi:MAG: RHS repeat-associated core domain-containing protein [Nitrospira sp.]